MDAVEKRQRPGPGTRAAAPAEGDGAAAPPPARPAAGTDGPGQSARPGVLRPLKAAAAEVWRWWRMPRRKVAAPAAADDKAFVLTGPALIEKIARCIELNQSILLEGPRGCGKSFCVRAGIAKAVERNVIPRGPGAHKGAYVFVQGNREIPRDYLGEDEITFRLQPPAGGPGAGKDEVVPDRKSAPLFRFAVRNPADGKPALAPGTNRVVCRLGDEPCDRFVLFLDEINRFSDGVLDSLLSILEERTAVLSGQELELPVTVCMTMNPPGYDSSARKLSPPLAARIGRTYRLSTPDVDTMSDLIVPERLAKMRQDRQSVPVAGQPWIELQQPRAMLVRKAALVTLCLWGDITLADARPKAGGDDAPAKAVAGLEYLTEGTKTLLKRAMAADADVAAAMREMSKLSHYGPDGRAIADWIVSAAAAALADAAILGESSAAVREKHLIETAINTISHKIYDSFSAASRPDLVRAKEKALTTIVTRVLNRSVFDGLVRRKVDNAGELWAALGGAVFKNAPPPGRPIPASWPPVLALRAVLLSSQVTSDDDLAVWSAAANDSAPPASVAAAFEAASERGRKRGTAELFVAGGGSEKHSFCDPRFNELAKALAELPAVTAVGIELATFWKLVVRHRAALNDKDRDALDKSIVRLRSGGSTAARWGAVPDALRKDDRVPAQFAGIADGAAKVAGLCKLAPRFEATLAAMSDRSLTVLDESKWAGNCAGEIDEWKAADVPSLSPGGERFAEFGGSLGPLQRAIEDQLEDRSIVSRIGLAEFMRALPAGLPRGGLLPIADALEELVNLPLGGAWAAPDDEAGQFRLAVRQRVRSPAVGATVGESDLSQVVASAADAVFASNAAGSLERADYLRKVARSLGARRAARPKA